jgi:hypothetical protein
LHPNSSVGSKRSAFPVSPNLYIAEARKDLSCVLGTFRIGCRAHLAGHLSGWDYASGMPIVNVRFLLPTLASWAKLTSASTGVQRIVDPF